MLFELDQLEQFVNCLLNFLARPVADTQTVADIFLYRHLREERIRLKDDAYASFAGGKFGDVFVVKNYFPGIGLFQTGDDAQNRSLSASRGAKQNQRLALRYMEGDVVKHTCLAETFTDTHDAGSVGCSAPVGNRIHLFVHNPDYLSHQQNTSTGDRYVRQTLVCRSPTRRQTEVYRTTKLIDVKPVPRKKQHTENQE